MRVRLVTRGVYVKRFWSGAGINKMLLSDNGSGVLLSTAGARLLNRTRAGINHVPDAPFTGLSLNQRFSIPVLAPPPSPHILHVSLC